MTKHSGNSPKRRAFSPYFRYTNIENADIQYIIKLFDFSKLGVNSPEW